MRRLASHVDGLMARLMSHLWQTLLKKKRGEERRVLEPPAQANPCRSMNRATTIATTIGAKIHEDAGDGWSGEGEATNKICKTKSKPEVGGPGRIL